MDDDVVKLVDEMGKKQFNSVQSRYTTLRSLHFPIYLRRCRHRSCFIVKVIFIQFFSTLWVRCNLFIQFFACLPHCFSISSVTKVNFTKKTLVQPTFLYFVESDFYVLLLLPFWTLTAFFYVLHGVQSQDLINDLHNMFFFAFLCFYEM